MPLEDGEVEDVVCGGIRWGGVLEFVIRELCLVRRIVRSCHDGGKGIAGM